MSSDSPPQEDRLPHEHAARFGAEAHHTSEHLLKEALQQYYNYVVNAAPLASPVDLQSVAEVIGSIPAHLEGQEEGSRLDGELKIHQVSDQGGVLNNKYPVAWGQQEKEISGADDEFKTADSLKQGDTDMGEQIAAGDNGDGHVPFLGRGGIFGIPGDLNGDGSVEPEERIPFRTKNELPNNDDWFKPQGVWTGQEGGKAGSGPETPVQNTEREWIKPQDIWTEPEDEETPSIRRNPVHYAEQSELEFPQWYQQRKENSGRFAARHHAQRADAFEHRGRMSTSPASIRRISPCNGPLNPTDFSTQNNERRFDVHYASSNRAENGSVRSSSPALAVDPSGHPIGIENPPELTNNRKSAAKYVVYPSNPTHKSGIFGPWGASIRARAGHPPASAWRTRKPVPTTTLLSQFPGVPTGHPSSTHPQCPTSTMKSARNAIPKGPKVTTSEIPAPTSANNAAGKTIFLLYPGMIPVKYVLDATTTYGDLKALFRRRRFLTPLVKVEIAPWFDCYGDEDLVEDLRGGVKEGEEFSVQISW